VVTITGEGTITYTYDAAGNKLQKTIVDISVTPNRTTNYFYAGDFVYRNGGSVDTLELISHPEGRIRPVRIDTTQAISMTNLKYIYDYFLKDHLGSVRSVLTTEQQTDIYAATMETAAATKENALFSNVSSTAVTRPAGMSNDNSNKMASKLNGAIGTAGNNRVGPAIVLKVMAGDTISLSTLAWYQGAVQPPATGVAPIVNDLLPLLTAGVTAAGGTKGGAIPTGTSGPLLSTDMTNFLSNNQPYDNTKPKAFLNWMVVDEEFAGVTSTNHMNALQVPAFNAGDTNKLMVGLNRLVIRRNGWIYIYLSNESSQDIYFDNLVVNLTHGPLVEQKDYYAFGLEIPGLSTKALKLNYKENRYKYNGKEIQEKEFADSSGLTWEDYGARMYDPQIGRWMVVDPMSEKMRRFSPYAFTLDNPIRFIDPDGMVVGGTGTGDLDDQLSDNKGGKKPKSVGSKEPPHPPTLENNPVQLKDKTINVILTPDKIGPKSGSSGFQISIYGAGDEETGRQADLNKTVYAVPMELMTTIAGIGGFGRPEIGRTPIPFLTVELAKTVLEASGNNGDGKPKTSQPTTGAYHLHDDFTPADTSKEKPYRESDHPQGDTFFYKNLNQ
jgi:RHS repeat-associated protein